MPGMPGWLPAGIRRMETDRIMTTAEVFQHAQAWSGVVGLAFDIVGAILVYLGVRTPLRQAFLLERQVVGKTIDEIGAPEVVAKNEAFQRDRARERTRASQSAWWGLVFFVLGFALQAVSAWPKTA
jgi:hypothetical protein